MVLVVAAAAHRAGLLSRAGAIGAIAVGVPAALAGPAWAVLLVGYFAASSVLSRLGEATKRARTDRVIEKGGPRDAWQVLANGGAFAVAALLALVAPPPDLSFRLAATGALAASAADTFATEIGTWLGGTPRDVRHWRPVPPGTSGGVTIAGSAGMVLGALVVTLLAALVLVPELRVPRLAALMVVIGVAGAVVDTLLGAWVQRRRWCPTCRASTEQRVHPCGTPTQRAGGWAWLGNDAVNTACTLVGAILAGSVVRP